MMAILPGSLNPTPKQDRSYFESRSKDGGAICKRTTNDRGAHSFVYGNLWSDKQYDFLSGRLRIFGAVSGISNSRLGGVSCWWLGWRRSGIVRRYADHEAVC